MNHLCGLVERPAVCLGVMRCCRRALFGRLLGFSRYGGIMYVRSRCPCKYEFGRIGTASGVLQGREWMEYRDAAWRSQYGVAYVAEVIWPTSTHRVRISPVAVSGQKSFKYVRAQISAQCPALMSTTRTPPMSFGRRTDARLKRSTHAATSPAACTMLFGPALTVNT